MSERPVYLLDSNIFISYFNNEPEVADVFQAIDHGQVIGCYSPVTWIELLSFPGLSDAEIANIQEFLSLFEQIILTTEILNQAAYIRRAYRVKLPDALIAACAIATQSILVTRDTKDFMAIRELNIINPFQSDRFTQ